MPFVDGFGVMEQIRAAAGDRKYVPILVLTADASNDTKRRTLAAGASDFLTKPFDHFEAALRIQNLLEISSLHRKLREHNANLETRVAARTKDYQDALTQLRDTQQQVIRQERLSALGTMASGIAHDFNNALTMVIGFAELLGLEIKEKLNSEQFDCLERILQSGKDAAKIVERLREFYRPTDEMEPRTSVDLNLLVTQAVGLTAPKWREQTRAAGIRLDVDTYLGKISPVSGNAAELREILTNLIFNSVDAMPDGGRIAITTKMDRGEVLLAVSDKGSGMPEEVRQRCFEPFFTTKGDKGTGLGLSAVYGIVQRHDGKIDIDSEIGEGTTFTIRFPVSQLVAAPVKVIPDLEISLRVLVVDDQDDVRSVLVQQLMLDGHITDSASDGITALQKLDANSYDIVVTDKAMPLMSGLQLADKIKRRSPDMPIVLITGFDSKIEDNCESVNAVVQKPVTSMELRQALLDALNSAQAKQELAVPA
jgi:signal transduction histidine kinase